MLARSLLSSSDQVADFYTVSAQKSSAPGSAEEAGAEEIHSENSGRAVLKTRLSASAITLPQARLGDGRVWQQAALTLSATP